MGTSPLIKGWLALKPRLIRNSRCASRVSCRMRNGSSFELEEEDAPEMDWGLAACGLSSGAGGLGNPPTGGVVFGGGGGGP